MDNLNVKIEDIDTMDISIKEIICFVTVAENGSITKAAQKLFIAQPYLSKTIQGLEKKTGILLFERTGKSLRLTPAGKIFHEQMMKALGLITDGFETARSVSGNAGIVLNVGVSYDLDPVRLSSGNAFLGDLLHNADTECGTFHDLLDRIRAGLSDCVIVFREYAGYFPECTYREIERMNTHVLAGKDHPFAGREEILSADLASEEICFYIERTVENRLLSASLVNYCRQLNVDPKKAHIATNYLSALYHVTKHGGFVIGNKYSLLPDSGSIRSVPVRDRFESLYLICPEQLSAQKKKQIGELVYSAAA